LADNIDLQSPSSFETGAFSSFPAARALAEFGSVALPAVFARLGGEKSERQLRLFALVVLQVDGKRLATRRLEQLIEEHVAGKDYQGELQPYIKNLRRLLEILQTVDFSRQDNWPARLQ
jgi:hypothetical protein